MALRAALMVSGVLLSSTTFVALSITLQVACCTLQITGISARLLLQQQTLPPWQLRMIAVMFASLPIGTFLYVSLVTMIVRIDVSQVVATVTILAGSDSFGSRDGVGAYSQFSVARGVALNWDESFLYIVDAYNFRIRRLELASNNVTTVAGMSRSLSSVDGPGAAATFADMYGAYFYCNHSSMLCGALVGEFGNSAARFVAVETFSFTAAISASTQFTLTVVNTHSRSTSKLTVSPQSTQSGTTCPSHSDPHHMSASFSHVTRTMQPTITVSPFAAVTCLTQSRRITSTDTLTTPLSRTSSATRGMHGGTPSPTVYCALVPKASGSLVLLHSFNATMLTVLPEAVTATLLVAVNPVLENVTGAAVTAKPVRRHALLGGNALAANMSLTLAGTLRGVDDAADGWALVGALLDVVTTDAAFPVLSAPASVTVVSSSVAGREQLLVGLLRPPNGTGSPRWLPSTLGSFRDVTLRLRLRLRCPTDALVTQDVVVVVPSPGQAVILGAEVSAASTAAEYASLIAFPSTGAGVGRLSAVRRLVACDGSAAVNDLLPLPVAADCEDGVVAADARGAVLGNLVLWAAGCALMALLTCGYSRGAAVPLRTAAEALGVPSPLLPLVVATVPSTASSTFVLLRSSCAADRGMAAVGVVLIVCLVGVLCGLSLLVPNMLLLDVNEAFSRHSLHDFFAVLRALLARLMRRRVRWGCRIFMPEASSLGRPLRLERVATVVLLEYAVVWYLCVDVAVLTAAGLLGAVSTLGSLAACRGSAVAVAVLYVGQLVLCAAVRPYTTLFSHVHTLFCLAMGAASVLCQVWYLFASARDGADLDALGALLAASAVCDIVVSAVSILKTLSDVLEALRACRRHVDVLIFCAGDTGTTAEGPVLDAECTPLSFAENPELPANAGELLALLAEDEDAQFWRSDGSAVVDGDAFVLGGAAVDTGVSTVLENLQHHDAAHDLLLHFRDPVLLE